MFWLGQAAGDAATRGLNDIVVDNSVDREVREQAVFALSQRPRDEGVPALIAVARTNKDPEIRKKALFWLGQSHDARAIDLFEELLTKKIRSPFDPGSRRSGSAAIRIIAKRDALK